MPELKQLFSQRRTQFERDVAAMPDAKAAYDVCVRYLGDVRRDYLDASDDSLTRLRLNELMAAAEGGIAMMVAVSQVDIKLALPNNLQAPPNRRVRMTLSKALHFLPGALCTTLAAWLFLIGQLPAAALALVSAGTSVVSLNRIKPQNKSELPDVMGETRVDPVELGRWLDELLRRMDEMMMVKPVDEQDGQLRLNSGFIEAVQMLMEANLTDDGRFALKALPQMMNALESQGIEIEMYSDEGRLNFDLLAAPVGGETIRPALIKDGKLLMRGQATIKG